MPASVGISPRPVKRERRRGQLQTTPAPPARAPGWQVCPAAGLQDPVARRGNGEFPDELAGAAATDGLAKNPADGPAGRDSESPSQGLGCRCCVRLEVNHGQQPLAWCFSTSPAAPSLRVRYALPGNPCGVFISKASQGLAIFEHLDM